MSQDPIGFHGGDTNLYRYTENKPIINSDPFGLMMLPDDGFTGPVGDIGIQMIVDSYIRNNDGNVDYAWMDLVGDRKRGDYGTCDMAASAEHYLYSRSESLSGNGPAMLILVPGYQLIKILTPQKSNQTPPSWSQVRWGYKSVLP